MQDTSQKIKTPSEKKKKTKGTPMSTRCQVPTGRICGVGVFYKACSTNKLAPLLAWLMCRMCSQNRLRNEISVKFNGCVTLTVALPFTLKKGIL
jgi:hypothetical protein